MARRPIPEAHALTLHLMRNMLITDRWPELLTLEDPIVPVRKNAGQRDPVRRAWRFETTETTEREVYLLLQHLSGELIYELATLLKPAGITPEQYHVLRILEDAGSAGTQLSSIAERSPVGDPDVTRLLDRLEERNWRSARARRPTDGSSPRGSPPADGDSLRASPNRSPRCTSGSWGRWGSRGSAPCGDCFRKGRRSVP